MRALLRRKFGDPGLCALLCATGERHLVEGNTWHDTFWGVWRWSVHDALTALRQRANVAPSCSRCDARGQNRLGLLLMEIRTELNDDRGRHLGGNETGAARAKTGTTQSSLF